MASFEAALSGVTGPSAAAARPGQPPPRARRIRAAGLARLAALGLLALPAAAGAADPSPPVTPRLAVHGYLNQAYAVSDEHPILGIPEEGTTDYRTLALQFRYALTDKDALVVQLSHERFGKSPFAALRQDVEVDWAFYQRRFSDAVSVRVGKVQIPLGIYNEIRDVGTLLPFYRPPANFYGVGAFTTETVDGVVLSYSFARGARFSPSLDVYYGGFDLIEVDPTTDAAFRARASDDVGGQVWVETPLKGLRLGAGAARLSLRDQLLAPPEAVATLTQWQVSVDGSFDRVTTRGELQVVHFKPGRYLAWNAHLGLKLAGKLTANVQADLARLRFTAPQGPGFDGSFNEDYAAGVDVAFRSDLVLKLEGHWTKGFHIDEPVDLFFGSPAKARYAILSLSASF